MIDITITNSRVEIQLKSPKHNEAPEHDGVVDSSYTESPSDVVPFFSVLHCQCLEQVIVPTDQKIGKSLIYKKQINFYPTKGRATCESTYMLPTN